MILSDVDIRKEVKAGRIEITGFNEKSLGSNSYDLSLSEHLLIYDEETLDCRRENAIKRFTIPPGGLVLQPGELYLGSTVEKTTSRYHVPSIEGKSSIGRLGLSVHVTAGFGDLGFSGHWTLEMTVVKPLRIYARMPVAQVMFVLPLTDTQKSYARKGDAKYQNQAGVPMPSAMWKNFEVVM